MSDDMDTAAAVASYLQSRRPDEAVRTSLTLAAGVDADAEAEFARLSKAAGLPIDSVRDNKAAVQQRLSMPDPEALAREFPGTTKYLSTLENARIAHDDVGGLTSIEKAIRGFFDPTSTRKPAKAPPKVMTGREYSDEVRALVERQPGIDYDTARRLILDRSTVDNQSQLIGEARGPRPTAGNIFRGLFDLDQFRVASAGATVAAADVLGFDPARTIREFDAVKARTHRNTPEFETATGQGLYGGLVSTVRNSPGIALSILSGNPLPGLAMAGGQSGAETYGKVRSRGGSAGESAASAALTGGIEVATELLPMRFMVDRLGKAGAGEFIKGLLAREIPGEQLATLAQDAVDTAIANPDKTWAQFAAERPAAAYQTLLATVVQTGVMGAANKVAGKITGYDDTARQADEAAARAQEFAGLVEQSKLRQRDPEAFKSFIAEIAESGEGPAEMYIDAEQLTNSLNQGAVTMDELRAMAPTVADQLEAAKFVPGADIRIPIAEFAAAPSEIATALVDHLRESPEAMSRAEAQEFLKTQGDRIKQDVESALTEEVTRTSRQEATETARKYIEDQLTATGKYRPEVNKAYAAAMGSFYATQAERSGLSIEDFMERYQLKVARKDGPLGSRQRLEQAAVETPEFKAWFGDSKVVDAEGKPLRVFHVTRADITEFQTEGNRTSTNDRLDAAFFTDSVDYADAYAYEKKGEGVRTMPAYLSMQNPLVVGADPRNFSDPRYEQLVIQQARTAGHDGVAFHDAESGATFYAAFEPTQVKSATGNRGTFDPNDPNILNQGDGPRGTLTFGNDITDVPSIIALMEGADLSTFLHESGHWFLEVQSDLAARIQSRIAAGEEVGDSERGIVADMNAILGWFGVTDTPDRSALDTWVGMTLEEKREHHEKWARGFEKYVGEGKAPTLELQTLFAKFRAWILSVYKALKGLDVDLSDEVRQVMDRMLATDDAIAEAEMAREMGPLFDSPEQAGMTSAEYRDYQALGTRQTNEAAAQLDARLMKDMKWLSRARDKALKARQSEVDDLRREVRAEVRGQVMAEPIYRAWAFLAGKLDPVAPGTVPVEKLTGTESGKLRTSLVKQISPDAWSKLSERRMTSEDRGMDPDIVADVFGFTSGDQLVNQLARIQPPAQVIEEMTDRVMLERYGDITSEQALQAAADEAIHNEVRARMVAAELKALEKATTVRGGKRSTIDVMARAAKEYAYAVIAGQRVRDLRPSQYSAAAARNARLAKKALGKSTEEAAMHSRNELINTYAARAAYDAQDEVKGLQRYFRKFDKRIDSIDPGYQDQIEQLLERFDFKPASLRDIDKRKSFAAWYAEQEAAGNAPDVSDSLLDDAARKSYKDMTVEELRGLRDTVKQIEHQGRLKKKLLLARDALDFDAIATEIEASIIENGGKPREVKLEGENPVVDWFAGVAAQHRKLASLFRQMDGNNDAGPLWQFIGRGMNERSTMEDVALERATMQLRELYAPLLKMRGGITGHRSKVFIPEINDSLTRGGRLSVALNWGNEANRQRIMDGDKWSIDQVQAILKTLSATELEFVNKTWEFLDSYWPEVAAKEKRLTGVEPPKVDAAPFNVTSADGVDVAMRGGYYPLKYDTDRSDRADQQEAAQVAKEMMQGVFTKATTRRGHTKERLKEVKRAVRKDLNVITQHVTQVVHDLSWHEWLIDTNKLLGDDRIAGAIREYYGPKVLKTIRDGVLGIATADVVPQTDVDKGLLWFRSNVTRATMGASLTTAFLQPFGLTQSIVRIGGRHVLRGLARWGGDAARMESAIGWIHERSEFMRLRAKTFNRELREIRGSVDGKSATMRVIDAGLFVMMQKMQMVADVPTWLGQYEKSISEGASEADAVALADRMVLESQGGGNTKDMAEVQRKHPMLTQFYSYFSVTLNLAAEQTAATDFKNPAAVAGWLGDMALLMVIPAILPSFILYSLRGGGDDDEKTLAKRALEWQLSYLLGTVVGLRELSGVVSGFDYAGPPVGRVIGAFGKAGKQTVQGEVDEPAVLAYVNLIGTIFGIPVTQALRSYKGWKAWDEGQDGAGAQSVLLGPPPRD